MFTKVLVFIAVFGIQNVLVQGDNMVLLGSSTCQDIEGTVGVTIDDESQKIDAWFDLKKDLSEYIRYDAYFNEIKNGKEIEKVIACNGTDICGDFHKILKNVWKKICDMSGMGDCPIAAGRYEVEGYEFHVKDLELERFMNGHFNLFVIIYTEDGIAVCQVIEFEYST